MANENEDQRVAQSIQAVLACAVEHETRSECSEVEHRVCWDNRYHLVAKTMHTLGLELSDIGFIAEAWLDIECEIPASVEPEAEPEPFGPNDVLNVE